MREIVCLCVCVCVCVCVRVREKDEVCESYEGDIVCDEITK